MTTAARCARRRVPAAAARARPAPSATPAPAPSSAPVLTAGPPRAVKPVRAARDNRCLCLRGTGGLTLAAATAAAVVAGGMGVDSLSVSYSYAPSATVFRPAADRAGNTYHVLLPTSQPFQLPGRPAAVVQPMGR